MSAQANAYIPVEQYLATERASLDARHEYVDGHMYLMAGGTKTHTRLLVAIASAIFIALRGSGCSVGSSDIRVKTATRGPYFYPDVVVWCESNASDAAEDEVSEPTLIAEVLSPSTEAYDHGEKFRQYRQIASLREYVLISQNRPLIETFAREDGGEWKLRTFAGWDAVCDLESVGSSIPLAAIYDGIPDRS